MVHSSYDGVTTRFLRKDEHLVTSSENTMPLVIEANQRKDIKFLQEFLKANSESLMIDVAKYGALLFRGFDIKSDKDFENTILSINGLHGISDSFLAEHGRERVDGLKYVLHTNTIYKTGGTLYLGGFHTENYYNPDVPEFISFCCLKPSDLGGETGLVNFEKVYEQLNDELKERLEKGPCFVDKWLVNEVAKRYKIDTKKVEEICRQFDLPIVGEGEDKLILMYKPTVFLNPITKMKSLQLNCFSLPTLDDVLRQLFTKDYQGKTWFWNRFFWKLPHSIFKAVENLAIFFISLFHSPKEVLDITQANWKTARAFKKINIDSKKLSSLFTKNDIDQLASLMRQFYVSTIWTKGDILLVDNRKVAHTGMPGAGPRTIRALIANPVKMKYSLNQSGVLNCEERKTESIGYYMVRGDANIKTRSDLKVEMKDSEKTMASK
jgi:alpha-ketoglutarate-dependent taurine dioxygenase